MYKSKMIQMQKKKIKNDIHRLRYCFYSVVWFFVSVNCGNAKLGTVKQFYLWYCFIEVFSLFSVWEHVLLYMKLCKFVNFCFMIVFTLRKYISMKIFIKKSYILITFWLLFLTVHKGFNVHITNFTLSWQRKIDNWCISLFD